MSNDIFPTLKDLSKYTASDLSWHDPHSVVTIKLVELIDGGWVNWYSVESGSTVITPNVDWVWDYYDLDQYKSVCDKFNARYMWDEISILPPLQWKQQLIRKLNEIMPKYKFLYKAIADGADPMQYVTKYGKSRNIFSEFPETLLNGNSDYISNGNDREYEDIEQGNLMDVEVKYKDFNDIDVMILDELEVFFTGLYSVSENGW